MKLFLTLTLPLLALSLLLITAPTTALAEADYSFLGIDELESSLPDEAQEALDGQSISPGLDVSSAFGRVLSSALDSLGSVLASALAGAVAVLAASFLCSVVTPLAPSADGFDYVNLVGVFVILAATASGVKTIMGEAIACVTDMHDLSTLLLPVLASASAASGAAASGAAKLAASALFINVLMTLGQKLIIPLIYMYLAAGAGEAAFGGSSGGVAKLIARLIKHLLTILVMSFTIYLSATALIASSADAVAVKLTKTAISTLLPVVGGMVSDASDAVASGVRALGSAAGAFGIVAILSVCILPFLRLIAGAFLYRAAAELASTVAGKRLSGLIETVATAHSLTLALAGTYAIMLLISILIATRLPTS